MLTGRLGSPPVVLLDVGGLLVAQLEGGGHLVVGRPLTRGRRRRGGAVGEDGGGAAGRPHDPGKKRRKKNSQ